MRIRDLRDLEEPTIAERPIGLVIVMALSAAAAIVILFGAVELVLGALAFEDWSKPRLISNAFIEGVQVYPEHYLIVAGLLVIPFAFLAGLAIGIWRRRGWVIILGLVAGGLLACYGLLALVIPGDADANRDRWHLESGLPWLILGLVLIRYFDRRSIRRELGWGDPTIG